MARSREHAGHTYEDQMSSPDCDYDYLRAVEAECSVERRDPQCNRCGSTDVRWRQQGGRWVLFSLQPGVEHRCAPTTDGFAPIAE